MSPGKNLPSLTNLFSQTSGKVDPSPFFLLRQSRRRGEVGDGAASGGGQAREKPVGGRRELVAGVVVVEGWVGGAEGVKGSPGNLV